MECRAAEKKPAASIAREDGPHAFSSVYFSCAAKLASIEILPRIYLRVQLGNEDV